MPAVAAAKLRRIAKLADGGDKVKKFKSLFDSLVCLDSKKAPDVEGVLSVIQFVIESIGEKETVVSKPVLAYFMAELEKVEEDFNDQLQEICEKAAEMIRPKYTYFAGPLVAVVRLLSELYQADENWRQAARILSSVDTEDQYISGSMKVAERALWRIQTAKFYLMNEDNTNATTHIQKSRRLLRDVSPSHEDYDKLVLQHKTCYSQILDSERKFLAASVNYMELSQINSTLVGEADLLRSLENAVKCAILAPAGGNRNRVLAMLYRDERCKALPNWKILERMHKNMLVPKKEQDLFAATLSDHQTATLAGGLTVFQKAAYEHNMMAASVIYKNIRISELAKLLGVNDMQAEDLARGMMEEGRLNGSIDQVAQTIEFKPKQGSVLLAWDEGIQNLCLTLNDIVDSIDTKYPGQFEIP